MFLLLRKMLACSVPKTHGLIEHRGARTHLATAKLLKSASPDMPLGARLHLDNCAACHFVSGKGAPEIFPELQGNAMVLGKDASPLVSVILKGASSPATERRPMHLVSRTMPTALPTVRRPHWPPSCARAGATRLRM